MYVYMADVLGRYNTATQAYGNSVGSANEFQKGYNATLYENQLSENANYKNRSELLLWHKHDGMDLKADYAERTLSNLTRLWSRPVHIRTESDGKTILWSHDGSAFSQEEG